MKSYRFIRLSICMIVTAVIFYFGSALAAAKNDPDSGSDELKRLKQVVEKQQLQIDLLKRNLAKVYRQTLSETGVLGGVNLQNSVYLRSSYFALQRKEFYSPLVGSIDKENHNAFVNYLDLKFSAQPSQELKFHATLTMYKLWGAWNDPAGILSADFNYAERPSDSGIRLKRAYGDYRPEWLGRRVNLTFGRLPTSDGYLTRYSTNRPSQTTYPDLSFNAESDGAGLTFYLDGLFVDSVNVVYARSEDDTDQYPFMTDPQGLSDIDFYVIQANGSLPVVSNSSWVIQWFRVDNLRPTGDDLFLQMLRSYDPDWETTNGTIVFPDELGYVDKLTFQFCADSIADLPVDFFGSVSRSRSRPNGKKVTAGGTPLDPSTLPPEVAPLANYFYLVSPDNSEPHTGWAFYGGIRFHLFASYPDNPKIGVEYFHGSKYWVGLSIASTDPYQKLNTRGDVWEVYWIQPLVPEMFQLRTGWQKISRDYTESVMAGLYGPAVESDEKDRLFYCTLELMF